MQHLRNYQERYTHGLSHSRSSTDLSEASPGEELGLRDRVHAVVHAYESGLVRTGGHLTGAQGCFDFNYIPYYYNCMGEPREILTTENDWANHTTVRRTLCVPANSWTRLGLSVYDVVWAQDNGKTCEL
ncbi:hypothetical protein [Nonomuraea helvata]|uniref:hypothetical protein n=1 Tax=Nonomuraea helvata TaxID=37484 RepID=UPI003380F172